MATRDAMPHECVETVIIVVVQLQHETMAIESRTDPASNAERRSRMARALATSGFKDVLVTDRETAKTVLTEKRQELIARIREGGIESVRALADDLDRDVSGVSRDLDLLFEADIVEFDTEGQRKIPCLKHDTVVTEPIA